MSAVSGVNEQILNYCLLIAQQQKTVYQRRTRHGAKVTLTLGVKRLSCSLRYGSRSECVAVYIHI